MRLLFAVVVAFLVMLPHTARAADDDVTEMARQRFREGVQFYDQRQYEKARLAFLQSYAIKPHPATLLNLAQSELRAGHPDDAANHFSEYLRTNSGANESEKQEAELGFTAAKAKVGEVTVAVDASGAQVSVDGQEKGLSPLPGPLYVTPGSHSIEARSNDRNVTKSVSVAAGQAVSVNLSFRGAAAGAGPPAAAGPAPERTQPPVLPESGAPEQGPATAQPEPEQAEISTEGRKPFFKWLVTTPGGLVLGGLAIAGFATSGVTALASSHSYENARNLQDHILGQRDQDAAAGFFGPDAKANPELVAPCNLTDTQAQLLASKGSPQRPAEYADACRKYQDNANSGDTLKTVAVVSGIVGGAALVGTVVYYFVDSKPSGGEAGAPRKAWARVTPWGSLGGGGIGVVGQF